MVLNPLSTRHYRCVSNRPKPIFNVRLLLFFGPCLTLATFLCPDATARTSAHKPWHGSVTLGVASETIDHGISLSDNQLTPDARLAVQHHSGLFASAWATRVDLSGLVFVDRPREWQLAYDVGYGMQLNRNWSLSASHTWYQYTDSGSASFVDNDYRAWTTMLHYSDYASLLYSTTNNLWGHTVQQDSLSLVVRYPFSERLMGEVEYGAINSKRNVKREYQFARINLGYVYDQWSVQLQYHYSSSEAQQLYRKDRVGSHLAAKLSYHFSIR